MDERNCFEIRPGCLMKDRSRASAICPAYREGLNCWEFDWRKEMEHLPASQEEYWFLHLSKCPACQVYGLHPAEMQARIDEVKVFYHGK